MRSVTRRLSYLILLTALLVLTQACSSPLATTTATTTTSAPTLKITAPTGGGTGIVPGNITVTVEVTNFQLVDKLGQANVSGQGHLHYFLDVDAPTTPGQPAVTAPGTYAATASTSYTWPNVTGGQHKFSVELINNDHTPLVPPVVASVNLLVVPEIGPSNVVIASPRDGASLPAGPVTVTAQATNFNLVDKLGQPNAQREGHLHYFLDVDAPTTPGQPAVTAPGTYFATANTSYTWPNVAAGTHKLSVELVNNDHTPLSPPVVATVTVTVTGSTTTPPPTTTTPPPTTTPASVTISLAAQSFAFDKSTITVPRGASVTINFNNLDYQVPHNFAVYTDSSATTKIFQGAIISGGTTTYTFTAPSTPGNYFFRCDVHPTQMTGTFIVQ